MKKHKDTVFMVLAIFCIILFGIAISPIELQNDTFYTIKIGQFILANGIADYDPFSWHELLPYTFPHWLYDVTIGGIYNLGGMFGVYLATVGFTAILGISWFLINCKLNKNKLTSFILSLAMLYLMNSFIAARAQLVTFIIFIFEIFFIEKFLDTAKKRYAIGLIILPIIIANVHLAVFPFYFVLFLPYIAEYIISIIAELPFYYRKYKIHKIDKKLRKAKLNNEKKEKLEAKAKFIENQILIWQEKRSRRKKNLYKIEVEKNKNVKWLIIVMIICMFTGLLTPLGDAPYTYLVKTMKGNTTQNINEHLPPALINFKPQLCLIAFFIAILMFTDVKIRLKDLFMITGLLLLALMSRRQLSFLALIGLIVLNRIIVDFLNKYDKNGTEKLIKKIQTPIGLLSTILLVLIMCVPFMRDKLDDQFVDKNTYPVKASEFILENLDIYNIKLFNEYNYGSYLIYKGIPVFIDSRADLYTPEFNGSRDIFSDFVNTSSLSVYYEDIFQKYGITHVILYRNNKIDLLISRNKNYKKIYDDDKFVIYEKLEN